MPSKGSFVVISILAAFLVLFGTALAHRVSVFAWVEWDEIVAEAYFSGGGEAKNSRVEVFGPSGKKLFEGVTDGEGQVTFPKPGVKGDLRIVLTASMGHGGEFVLPASELGVEKPGAETPAGQEAKKEAAVAGAGPKAPAGMVEVKTLEEALDRVLEKRLKPLYGMVAELKKDRVSPTEVAGGIGYIVGILGLFAYFKARRMRDRE